MYNFKYYIFYVIRSTNYSIHGPPLTTIKTAKISKGVTLKDKKVYYYLIGYVKCHYKVWTKEISEQIRMQNVPVDKNNVVYLMIGKYFRKRNARKNGYSMYDSTNYFHTDLILDVNEEYGDHIHILNEDDITNNHIECIQDNKIVLDLTV